MTTLTQKSQVTVPKNIRIVLGLMPGDEVEFHVENGNAVLRKKEKSLPFAKWRGFLGKARTDRLMNELR